VHRFTADDGGDRDLALGDAQGRVMNQANRGLTTHAGVDGALRLNAQALAQLRHRVTIAPGDEAHEIERFDSFEQTSAAVLARRA
jgi:hypothetical protein